MYLNGIVMQYFEWYVASNVLWRQLKDDAEQLSQDGITAVWIPPAYKGAEGKNDAGYAVYDLYDLGEFDQKGSVATKYGTKDELLEAVKSAHAHNIKVYADIVLDHKMGADETEIVTAEEVNPENRLETESDLQEIEVWTRFTFPGRNKKYSDFEWHWYHFTGVDYDERKDKGGIFKFHGKYWERQVDEENGNYDYLMGASLDLNHPEVKEELKRWGVWFAQLTQMDGFRLDAVKHMKFSFYNEWLDELRAKYREEFFTVGEYWQADLAALNHYISTTDGALSLFDVPLHFKFFDASNAGNAYDMRTIFDGTLTQDNPFKSVTFVDNHDTQPGQSLESWVEPWFKPLAYAMILLRQDGYPCVFYGDYYGIGNNDIAPMRDMLLPLMKARKLCSYGKQHDYFDHHNTVGWTREGDDKHSCSGLAVLLTNGCEGEKKMFVGHKFAGSQFYDITGNRNDLITIEEDGTALFKVNSGSVSVWVKK